jgi:transposase
MAKNDMGKRAKKERSSTTGGFRAEGVWELVGLDLHMRECQLAVQTTGGEIVDLRIATRRDRLTETFGGRAPLRILLEAGTESEWVALLLEELGHRVVVADPNFAPMYATRTRKIKTDKRDAHALVDALRLGAYRAAHRCSAEQRAVKELLTVRDVLVSARTKSINCCRALLKMRGLRVGKGEAETFAQRVRMEPEAQKLEPVLGPLLRQQDGLNQEIEQLDKELGALARKDERAERLMTVPGVGPVTALAFTAQIDKPERFDSAKQVSSYLGLVPGEDSSGDGKNRRRITKTGDGRTRRLLVQAAHSLLRSKQGAAAGLLLWAQRLLQQRGRKIAVVALARKLAGILWAMLRKGTRFELRLGGRETMSQAA